MKRNIKKMSDLVFWKDPKEIIRERPSKGPRDLLYEWSQNMLKDELQSQSNLLNFDYINDAEVKIFGSSCVRMISVYHDNYNIFASFVVFEMFLKTVEVKTLQ